MALQNLTEDTFDEAVKNAPLAMVDVWATWCGPCKMIGPVVDKLAEEYDGKVKVGNGPRAEARSHQHTDAGVL